MIVERAYRGAVESQFADVLNCLRELHRQSGGIEVALRGLAASYALRSTFTAAMRLAGTEVDTLSDPHAVLSQLLRDGVPVWVERPDLDALGQSAPGRLLPGVRCLPCNGLVARWAGYERVWFM